MDKHQADMRSVARSTLDQRPAIASLLTAAFIKDPLVRYMYPDIHVYLANGQELFDAYGGGAVEHGLAFHTEDLSGAALWFPPGVHGDDERLGRLIDATISEERRGPTLEMLGRMESHHPKEPHWFLPLIGVDPAHQGKGLGGALLAEMGHYLDREGALAYLDSSNVLNIPLYERHGFEVLTEIRMDGLPPIFPMLRRPR